MVLEDGSDPSEVRHWQQQQAAEAELAAAEEGLTAGAKVLALLEGGLYSHACLVNNPHVADRADFHGQQHDLPGLQNSPEIRTLCVEGVHSIFCSSAWDVMISSNMPGLNR